MSAKKDSVCSKESRKQMVRDICSFLFLPYWTVRWERLDDRDIQKLHGALKRLKQDADEIVDVLEERLELDDLLRQKSVFYIS